MCRPSSEHDGGQHLGIRLPRILAISESPLIGGAVRVAPLNASLASCQLFAWQVCYTQCQLVDPWHIQPGNSTAQLPGTKCKPGGRR